MLAGSYFIVYYLNIELLLLLLLQAITIHGAQGIHVIKNVAFETRGHAIYLEDGTEYGNLIQENCVFNTREQIDDFLDAEDRTPASYWISNPNNMIIGNVAGGSRYAGFWIVPDRTAPGDSSICPRCECYCSSNYDFHRPSGIKFSFAFYCLCK